eukprot:Hpha_TRINITY_DN14352_c0_g1::TRINITY_DN14352_c0_g1_i1::g.86615::m.86615
MGCCGSQEQPPKQTRQPVKPIAGGDAAAARARQELQKEAGDKSRDAAADVPAPAAAAAEELLKEVAAEDKSRDIVAEDKSRDIARPKGNRNARRAPQKAPEDFNNHADRLCKAEVYMISGCLDEQTSKDVADVGKFDLPDDAGPGGAGGACTTALLDLLHKQENDDGEEVAVEKKPWTWCELLEGVRAYLYHKKYPQRPQLSCSHKIDLSATFEIAPEGFTGRRKALMMGINYSKEEKGRLDGCCNDVRRMINFIDDEGFKPKEGEMRILVDPPEYSGVADLGLEVKEPTKANILAGLDWLADSEPGDLLFLHYSGHGTQVPDLDGDEDDGFDEAVVPMDFRRVGMISDDVIYDRLLKKLKPGVKLFAVMDCCHSGTILDLPYTFLAKEGDLDKIYEERVMEPNTGFLGFLGKMVGF